MKDIHVAYYKRGGKGVGKYRAELRVFIDNRAGGDRATGTFPSVAAIKKWANDWKKAVGAKTLTFENIS